MNKEMKAKRKKAIVKGWTIHRTHTHTYILPVDGLNKKLVWENVEGFAEGMESELGTLCTGSDGEWTLYQRKVI